MVRFGQELGRVRGKLSDEDNRDLEVMVTKGTVVGVKTLKRKYLIDGTSKEREIMSAICR